MGAFITFEGIDGCGKSTQIKLLYEKLNLLKYEVVLTREPGGTPIAEKIREVILGTENTNMTSRCELLLYLAARAQHVEEKIQPALKEDKIVLSDRFEEATYVYQGFGRGIKQDTLLALNSFATDFLIPDLTFIIVISPEESEKRIILSGKAKDRMENNNSDFFNKIYNGYLERERVNPQRVYLIDGSKSIEEINLKILKSVLSFLDKNFIQQL